MAAPGASQRTRLTQRAANGEAFPFQIDAFRKHCLLEGLDEIGLTLAKEAAISRFEQRLQAERPWLSRGIALEPAHARA